MTSSSYVNICTLSPASVKRQVATATYDCAAIVNTYVYIVCIISIRFNHFTNNTKWK